VQRCTDATGFVDALRGVAVGATLHEIERTMDGGRTWRASPVRAHGSDKPIDFALRDGDGVPVVRCTSDGCMVGGNAWLGATETPRGVLIASHQAFDDDGDPSAHAFSMPCAQNAALGSCRNALSVANPMVLATPSVGTALVMDRYQCAGPGALVPSLLRVRSAVRTGVLSRTLLMPGVDGVLEESAVHGNVAARVRWHSNDSRGTFEIATTTAPLDVTMPLNDLSGSPPARYALWSAGRAGALLERALGAPSRPSNELLWAPPLAPLVAVRDATAFAVRDGMRAAVDGALATPHGGVAVLLTARTPERGLQIDTVLGLGPDGHVQLRRTFVYAQPRVHALARVNGTIGYVSAKMDDPRAFEFEPLDRTAGGVVRLPRMGERLALCGAQPRPGASEIHIANSSYVPSVWIASVQVTAPMVATLDVDATGGACVRALESSSAIDSASTGAYAYRGPQREIQLTVGADGNLSGFWDDGTNTQLVACTH
jgi:hypothetical protein